MVLTNRQIADMFETVADMLQIRGDNIHRVLSYRRASEVIRDLPRTLESISQEGGLTDIPNIGKTIAAKIDEMLETSKLDFYERLKEDVPPGVVDVLRINGVGPKKAKLFWQALDITSVEQLQTAGEEGKLRELAGMGAKSEQKILDGIAALARQTGRTPLRSALPTAQTILEQLLELPEVIQGTVAGSIRRGRPTIGDVDILIASENATPIMDAFVNMENVEQVLGHGPTKSSVILLNGLQVDVRVLAPERWGTALSYFTGSQAHNVRLRQLALQKGYSLNEHALSPVDGQGEIIEAADKILCSTEEAVYEALGLPWVAPELREDTGEIEAAQNNTLPQLITEQDIQSDLHMHTTWSDGKFSVREMAEAVRSKGYSYMVITDHSPLAAIANGLSIERLMEQQKEVRAVDAEMGDDFHVLHGTEMDIRADGTLDYPDEVLAQLDFVIASLHFSLRQPREQITLRLLNAIKNPHVDLIGHPTGRIILNREPADVDFDAVFAAAAEHNTALEINSNPDRLDLDAPYARRAIEMGIPISINTDAHSIEGLNFTHYGILTARRAWASAENVINTWDFERFQKWVNRQQ